MDPVVEDTDDEDAEMDESPSDPPGSGSEDSVSAEGAEATRQTSQFEPVDDREVDTATIVSSPPVLPPVESLIKYVNSIA